MLKSLKRIDILTKRDPKLGKHKNYDRTAIVVHRQVNLIVRWKGAMN